MTGNLPKIPIMSTAGAVPIKNEKGEISMEKVKVSRYVTGKRPEYAPESSGEDDGEEMELQQLHRVQRTDELDDQTIDLNDRRMRRILKRKTAAAADEDDDDRQSRLIAHREAVEPELIGRSDDEDMNENVGRRHNMQDSQGETSEEEELDEEEIERRREMIRSKVKYLRKDEEGEKLMDVEEGFEEDDEDESSEYEEYSDSEEEDIGPRLKPVFVRKKDRITIHEKEKESQKLKEEEFRNKKLANERRQQTLKLVEASIKRDIEASRVKDTEENVDSGDENDETEYEAWKVRELKRLKRDREEAEQMEKDKMELERIHNMTEEERRQEQKMNPKVVTNRAAKGKYKFLQKYYHRGVFFLDKEDSIYKRDYTAPTLEDHFNKTVLPKVMQVKNFGRSGRTKYTHLVDQDTTQFESPWINDTASNLKFHTNKGGGMKQNFEKPSAKKK